MKSRERFVTAKRWYPQPGTHLGVSVLPETSERGNETRKLSNKNIYS